MEDFHFALDAGGDDAQDGPRQTGRGRAERGFGDPGEGFIQHAHRCLFAGFSCSEAVHLLPEAKRRREMRVIVRVQELPVPLVQKCGGPCLCNVCVRVSVCVRLCVSGFTPVGLFVVGFVCVFFVSQMKSVSN